MNFDVKMISPHSFQSKQLWIVELMDGGTDQDKTTISLIVDVLGATKEIAAR